MHLDGRPVAMEDLPAVRALFHGEVVTRKEFNCFDGVSEPRRVCVSAAPVRGPSGAIIAAAGVVEDITGLRAQEAEQQRLREEERLAKAAAKAQADFIANMNHELRTPGAEALSNCNGRCGRTEYVDVVSPLPSSPRNSGTLRASDAIPFSARRSHLTAGRSVSPECSCAAGITS